MFIRELATKKPEVTLIEPNIERDARFGVRWLADPDGRRTLSLMGVAQKDNHPTTIEDERRRVRGFLTNRDQYNWMISVDGKVVGGVWVDLASTKFIKAPAISIMLGDASVRGRGFGKIAAAAVVDFMRQEGHPSLYARYLVDNVASQAMLHRLGFEPKGDAYSDNDNLRWQNASLVLAHCRVL